MVKSPIAPRRRRLIKLLFREFAEGAVVRFEDSTDAAFDDTPAEASMKALERGRPGWVGGLRRQWGELGAISAL